jgi:hypothetical protein
VLNIVLETIVDVTIYALSLKVIDTTLVFTAWGTTEVVVLVSTVMTFLSKWHNLLALYTRPDERSNQDCCDG